MTYPYRCKLYHHNPKWWTNFLAAVFTLPFFFLVVLLSAATKAVSNYTVNTSSDRSALSVLALYVSKQRLAWRRRPKKLLREGSERIAFLLRKLGISREERKSLMALKGRDDERALGGESERPCTAKRHLAGRAMLVADHDQSDFHFFL